MVYVSTAWQNEDTIVIGLCGVVYRFNAIQEHEKMLVKINDSFLQNTHFTRSHAAYIQIPYVHSRGYNIQNLDMKSKSIRTCALLNGFVELTEENSQGGYFALRGQHADVKYSQHKYIYNVRSNSGISTQYTTMIEACKSKRSIISSDLEIFDTTSTNNVVTHTNVCIEVSINSDCYVVIDSSMSSYVHVKYSRTSNDMTCNIVTDSGDHIVMFKSEQNLIRIHNAKLYTDGVYSHDSDELPITGDILISIHLCNGASIVKTGTVNDITRNFDFNRHQSVNYNAISTQTRLSDTWNYVHTYIDIFGISTVSDDPIAISVHFNRIQTDTSDGETMELNEQRTVAIDALTLLPVLSMGILITGCEISGGMSNSCGDNIFESDTEECDDGGKQNGDGCSDVCTIESGWNCKG